MPNDGHSTVSSTAPAATARRIAGHCIVRWSKPRGICLATSTASRSALTSRSAVAAVSSSVIGAIDLGVAPGCVVTATAPPGPRSSAAGRPAAIPVASVTVPDPASDEVCGVDQPSAGPALRSTARRARRGCRRRPPIRRLATCGALRRRSATRCPSRRARRGRRSGRRRRRTRAARRAGSSTVRWVVFIGLLLPAHAARRCAVRSGGGWRASG